MNSHDTAETIKAAEFLATQATMTPWQGFAWGDRLDSLDAYADKLETGGAVEQIAARLIRKEVARLERDEVPPAVMMQRQERKKADALARMRADRATRATEKPERKPDRKADARDL